MPTTSELIRQIGGPVHIEPDWGRSRRQRRLSDDQVRLIRKGTPALDHVYAIEFSVSLVMVQQVRRRKRYASVKDLPEDCA